MTQKLVKCNMKKITAHDRSNKYITTQTFNKLTSEDLSARLKLANVKTKSDIDDFNDKFRWKTDFDDKLKKKNKKVTWNKTKYVEAKKKITDLKNKLAQISEKGYYCFR